MVAGTDTSLDLKHLAELRELMEDEFELLIETFISDGMGRVTALPTLADAPDELRRSAHSLKGCASNLGAVELARLCADLEAQVLAGETVATHPLIEAVTKEFEAVRAALADMV